MKIPTPTHSTLEDIEERVKEDQRDDQDITFNKGSKTSSFIVLFLFFLICYVFI